MHIFYNPAMWLIAEADFDGLKWLSTPGARACISTLVVWAAFRMAMRLLGQSMTPATSRRIRNWGLVLVVIGFAAMFTALAMGNDQAGGWLALVWTISFWGGIFIYGIGRFQLRP